MEELILDDESLISNILTEQDSIASYAIQEDSFSSIMGAVPSGSSTPRVAKTNQSQRSRGSRGSSSGRLKCPQCDKDYANERTLSVHVKMHAMKGASSREPNQAELLEITRASVLESLVDIQKECGRHEPSISLGKCCQNFIDNFEEAKEFVDGFSTSFYSIFKSQNALLPSNLRSAVYVKFNKRFSSGEFTEKWKSSASKVCVVEASVLNIFIGTVMLKLCDKVLAKVLRHMQGNPPEENPFQKRSHDQEDSEEFQGLVYYIGGYVINKCLRQAARNPDSATWQLYSSVLKCKFLSVGQAGNELQQSASLLTECEDRGGLKHINQEAFDFFNLMFIEIMSLEGADGSLPTSRVEEHIFKNDIIIFMWDTLAGSELEEEQSLNLLIMIAHACTRVFHRGILKRRLNEDLKKAYSSVGLRARLCR